jgi:antitoxin (DNA-binding transcriptional repressor) of toxin-antitoxin stability system
MATPVSALQRNAAAIVRRVAASGLAEEITARGKVVAVLMPPPRVSALERLRQAGVIRPAEEADLSALFAEIDSLPATPGLMDALVEQRDSDL